MEFALPAGQIAPFDRSAFVPLHHLAEFLALEEELLARMRIHERIEGPQPRSLVPGIARHAPPQGALAVHHLVVAERQNIVLRVGVHHGEGDFVVVVAAVDRILGIIFQGVVHPPHVPLQVEAQTVVFGGGGHTRPGGRLLRNGEHTLMILMHGGVHFLEELHRIQVFPPTILVRQPFAVSTGIVEVQHGCHSIHPQAIHVEFFQPVEGVGHQEVTHLIAAEVEHIGAPVFLLAPPPVGVLIDSPAVEPAQREIILREVGGHPVHDDANAFRVERVDKLTQFIGGAPAGGGGVVAGDLITPRTTERVLGNGEEFDVRIAHLLHIRHQFGGKLLIAQVVPPRSQMHLVDAHGLHIVLCLVPLLQPLLVLPLVVRLGHNGAGAGRNLGAAGQRVSLVQPPPLLRVDGIFIHLTLAHAGDEDLPNTGAPQAAHGELVRVPTAEITNNRHTRGVRRPHRKTRALHRAEIIGLDLAHMRP